MNGESTHIVSAFDQELAKLNDIIIQMGGLAEAQINSSIHAVIKRDTERAGIVVEDDKKIDQLERELEELAVKVLALRQPMASDLRAVVGALKISSDIERIGDYAKNIAKRAIALAQVPPVEPLRSVPRMGWLVQQIMKQTLDAYITRDPVAATAAWQRDAEVDDLYNSLFRELLTYMMEDPRTITACTHVLFIAKNIERMGDHATNICEIVHFMATGKAMPEDRKKTDTTSFTVVDKK
tara:strand:+ start:5878 stop:6594 length:717 start_codon:yes stop_codon:yes gene_type:complete